MRISKRTKKMLKKSIKVLIKLLAVCLLLNTLNAYSGEKENEEIIFIVEQLEIKTIKQSNTIIDLEAKCEVLRKQMAETAENERKEKLKTFFWGVGVGAAATVVPIIVAIIKDLGK
jgi:hypothetical protein